jgi:LacI family transcriptional regulator
MPPSRSSKPRGAHGSVPSIRTVAERAGVSPSTASRAFRADGYTSEATRARVLQAARELEYEPHHGARSLRSRSSNMVGLVIQDITNPFYSYVAKGISAVMRRNGLVLLLSDSEEEREREAESLRGMLGARVDGLVITPTVGNADVLELLQRQRVAIVQVDRTIPGVISDTVLIDNFGGAYAATRHLLDLGHREIAVVAGPHTLTTGRERLAGFRAAMRDADVSVPEGYVKISHFRREDSYAAANELLDASPRPTALFAQNNALVEGVLGVIHERGLSVPGDVAVIGFDDPPWAELAAPALTVVRQPAHTIGVTAAELLVRRMRDRDGDPSPTNIVIAPTLVVRGSCGDVPDPDPRALVRTGQSSSFVAAKTVG